VGQQVLRNQQNALCSYQGCFVFHACLQQSKHVHMVTQRARKHTNMVVLPWDGAQVPYFHMVFDGQLVSEMSVSLSTEKLSKFRAELAAHKRSQPRMSTQPVARDSEQQQEPSQVPGNEWA